MTLRLLRMLMCSRSHLVSFELMLTCTSSSDTSPHRVSGLGLAMSASTERPENALGAIQLQSFFSTKMQDFLNEQEPAEKKVIYHDTAPPASAAYGAGSIDVAARSQPFPVMVQQPAFQPFPTTATMPGAGGQGLDTLHPRVGLMPSRAPTFHQTTSAMHAIPSQSGGPALPRPPPAPSTYSRQVSPIGYSRPWGSTSPMGGASAALPSIQPQVAAVGYHQAGFPSRRLGSIVAPTAQVSPMVNTAASREAWRSSYTMSPTKFPLRGGRGRMDIAPPPYAMSLARPPAQQLGGGQVGVSRSTYVMSPMGYRMI